MPIKKYKPSQKKPFGPICAIVNINKRITTISALLLIAMFSFQCNSHKNPYPNEVLPELLPYPRSTCINKIVWSDASTIVRQAPGSDNWPITWGSDNWLYTAYGDGLGFAENFKKKLSLGIARIGGTPEAPHGENIKTPLQQFGGGKQGLKASGMIMVEDVLYMWVRNISSAGEGSKLAWSSNLGKDWQWSAWKFKEFGYCTFINYGKNNMNSRDDYVYIITHDHPSAYERSDRFILMRVAKTDIKKRSTYEFFVGTNKDNSPIWSENINHRGAVFYHKNRCHRSGISYNSALKRYIWWQAKYPKKMTGVESRMFGVFEAPEPWGPWATVYYTTDWDVGAGETGSFPTKWMNSDGRNMYLVFSGDDSFSVRKANLVLHSCTK